ncbi:MAG: CmcI family methyltransferase [Candidatus Nitrosopolaris sp.]
MRVLKSLEEMGKKEFVPSIGPVKAKIIANIVKKHRPKRILEIGTLYGYSAILMANLLDDAADSVGSVVTIEIDKTVAKIARKNMEDAGFLRKVDIIVGDALEVIPKLRGKFDLLFIDATKEEYLGYLKRAEKYLAKWAVVIADNVGISENQMLDFLEYVRNQGRYKSQTIETKLEFTDDVSDAIELSIRIV